MITRDGRWAVASDPDNDRVAIVDTAGGNGAPALLADLELARGEEPGRVAEDGDGRVHVVLRRGGAIAVIDLKSGALLARRPVCAAPRGIAFDASANSVHVACASGDLVTMTPDSGKVTRRIRLEPDLRDVVVVPEGLIVSRFKSANLLLVDAQASVLVRVAPAGIERASQDPSLPGTDPLESAVAWRTVNAGPKGVFILDWLIVQTRNPRKLLFYTGFSVPRARVSLPEVAAQHGGHSLFHRDSGSGIACAQCHPEGGEDGRVWSFLPIGLRRTQALNVGLESTAPFHWDGDLESLRALVSDVFVIEWAYPSPILSSSKPSSAGCARSFTAMAAAGSRVRSATPREARTAESGGSCRSVRGAHRRSMSPWRVRPPSTGTRLFRASRSCSPTLSSTEWASKSLPTSLWPRSNSGCFRSGRRRRWRILALSP